MQMIFENLIQDQFQWAGTTKYKAENGKEVTDRLVEDFGWDGLIWTQAKYTQRFKNQGLEKDLLKIATYQFINWLKLGYHYEPEDRLRLDAYVNTTIETKSKYFPTFLANLASYEGNIFKFKLKHHPMDQVYSNLLLLKEGQARREETLLENVLICKRAWEMAGFDKAEIHNTDTGVRK